MAEERVRVLGVALWLSVLALGAGLAWRFGTDLGVAAAWVAAFTVARWARVPTPSGERLDLTPGVAAALLILEDDPATAAVALALGMGAAWIVDRIRTDEVRMMRSVFAADVVASAGMAAVYYAVAPLQRAALPSESFAELLALTAAGLVWYLLRAGVRALTGFEYSEFSSRYLWLLALEDWPAVVSLFASGTLFGFTFPVMGPWAFPVTLLPYGFSHVALVRYASTRRTYGQTIRALAKIPEVAGLAPVGHADRTTDLALAIAREMGLTPDQVEELEFAALMHDIGRITLNEPAILRAGYTDEDIARWGSQIVAEAPYLSRVATMVAEQCRPYRRPGVDVDPDVPIQSKIIKVASAYDKAVYELGLPPVEALEQIHRGSAYDFDPTVTASLRRVLVARGLLSV